MYSQCHSLMNCCLSMNQLQLSNTMRTLWFEHVMWTRSFIVSTLSDLKDIDAVTKRLLQNPVDFANIFCLYYGDQIAMTFEKLFTEHLVIAAQLVNAAKAGDTRKVEEQRKKWYVNADEISCFLGQINPCWSVETWRCLFYSHLAMTEKEAVLYLTGQYEASIAEYDEIQKEALMMADYMSNGIIQQCRI